MLEFIELNAILGVSHFTLYNHTIGPKAACILEHYINDSATITNLINNASSSPFSSSNSGSSNSMPTITTTNGTTNPNSDNNINFNNNYKNNNNIRPKVTIDLLPWNLRMRSQKEIRTEGLFASLNDCLYRSMYRYSHVALVDLDEFIIPHHNDTLTDLIR